LPKVHVLEFEKMQQVNFDNHQNKNSKKSGGESLYKYFSGSPIKRLQFSCFFLMSISFFVDPLFSTYTGTGLSTGARGKERVKKRAPEKTV
jgi:hypothetical protein